MISLFLLTGSGIGGVDVGSKSHFLHCNFFPFPQLIKWKTMYENNSKDSPYIVFKKNSAIYCEV